MRAAVVAAFLLGVAVVVAGCGDTLSLTPVAKAAEVSSRQTSEHMDMHGTVDQGGKTISMTGSGDFQNDPVLGGMSMSVDAAGQSFEMHEVMEGTTIFLSSAVLAKTLPPGKSWMSVDVQKAGKAIGLDLTSLESQSPTDTLAQLEATAGVAEIGTETIDGVATTHYRAVPDPDKLAKLNTALQKEGFSAQYEPIDVWIDGQGLVRRLHMTDTVSQGSSPAATTDITIDLSHYGESVNVVTPPPSETYDATTNGGNP